jgi:hypothetical protein
MDTELIDDLHHLSTISINIPIEKTSINNLIYIDNYHCMEDFLDTQSFIFQNAILKANDNKIEIILKNLNTAINTNCKNDIDLSNLLLMNEFRYKYRTNIEEKRISKMYDVISKFPTDDDLFKKYWLKKFIEDCSKIVENIKTILNINLLESSNEQDEKQVNIYPRIFTSDIAYNKFLNLLNEFGNTKQNLSNYSYIFHKMTYEGLIFYDLLQKSYIEMLSNFDISIDRIKPKGDIGKIALRDSIYTKSN